MDQEEEGATAGNEQRHNGPPQTLVATANLLINHSPKPPTQARAAHTPIFTTLHWSPDGTTLLLPTSHQTLETYILPPDLLTPPSPCLEGSGAGGGGGGHHTLHPYHTHSLPEPSGATTIHPSFNLARPDLCLYLTSPRTLPIRLISPFSSSAQGILASYPLIHARTEQYTAPHALVFNPLDHGGVTFFAGAGRLVATFDVTRDGEGPVGVCVLGKKRGRRGGVAGYLAAARDAAAAGTGMGGMVSAMDVGVERGVLATGMFKGNGLGLVDVRGGEAGLVGTLRLPERAGDGVTSVRFCPAVGRGDYLLVAERMSEVMHIFDVRNGVDVTADGQVWAGGTDGMVRVWGMQQGDVEPSSVWRGHEDAIGGLGLHPGGAGVLATCAGSRHLDDCIFPKREPGRERGIVEASGGSSDTDSSSSSDVVSISSISSVSDSSVSSSSASESISQPPAEAGLKIWAL